MSKDNINKKYALWKFFPILVFALNPKIDIISIPNYWQGIRLDDLVVLFYLIFFCITNKFKFYPNLIDSKKFGYYWILFFPYIVFSMLIGKIYGTDPQLLIAIRYLEYIALIIVLNQLDPPKEKIILIFKIYILLNFLIVIMQYFHLLGGLTSRGNCMANINDAKSYCFDKEDIKTVCFFSCDLGFMKNLVQPGGFLLNRVPGITGGPWELSFNLSLCIFGLVLFEKNLKKLIPYVLLVVIMMLISQTRGIIFGFVAGYIFLINDYKKAAKFTILILIFIIFIYLFDFFNFQEIVNDRFLIDYFSLLKIIIGAFSGSLLPQSEILGTGLESMWYRASSWEESISDLKKSKIMTIFGSGGSLIYTESFIIRVITSFGILGSLITMYFARRLPLFFIIFILVAGITIDMFVSFKIFVFSCLLLILMDKNKEKIIQKR